MTLVGIPTTIVMAPPSPTIPPVSAASFAASLMEAPIPFSSTFFLISSTLKCGSSGGGGGRMVTPTGLEPVFSP
jgi:hypothetical protein